MTSPNIYALTKAYLTKQTLRTRATLDQIVSRAPVAGGRVIPDASDISIHEGRRFEDATVMFLDISKFSARPAWTDAEQQTLLQILALFFTEMIRVIEDFGGVVEKNTGDGLMAYFVKQPDDDGPVQARALSAAITMFSAVDRLINPILTQSSLDPIQFRICLDHGPITVAKVGSARGFNGIVAIGTTANIAAKMLAVAEADSILVGTKVLAGLPESWISSFVELKTQETGWFFREDGRAYAFWEYRGRWKDPVT